MADNLNIYNDSRKVPPEAQKRIKGGRLSGMTDINPMWRIKKLTELFGPCGFGWKYEITEKVLKEGGNNEIAAFVDINLYVKYDGEWSEPIPGTGGSTFVAKESRGLHTSDECYKMALTDAISVACKSLGFGADIYWSADRTKYSNTHSKARNPTNKRGKISSSGKHPPKQEPQIKGLHKEILNAYGRNKEKIKPVIANYYKKNKMTIKSMSDITKLNDNQAEQLLKKIATA